MPFRETYAEFDDWEQFSENEMIRPGEFGMDEGGRWSPEVSSRNYAAAWTIIQACCEASILAGLINAPLVAQLAGAAALGVAERLGISEEELLRVQQLMAAEFADLGSGARVRVEQRKSRRRRTANDNRAGAAAADDVGRKPKLSPCDASIARSRGRRRGSPKIVAVHRLKLDGDFSDKGA